MVKHNKITLIMIASMTLLITGCSKLMTTIPNTEVERKGIENTDGDNRISSKYRDESEEKENKASEETEMSTNVKAEHNSSYADMCLEQLKIVAGSKPNAVYSPMSLATALSLAEEVIIDGDAKDTISKFVGHNEAAYLGIKNSDTFRSVNRIWANNDKGLNFSDEAAKYVASIDMSNSKKATKEKDDYVAENTDNFITSTPTELNEDTIIDIMNILYFKDKWDVDGGYVLESFETDFHNDDGSTTGVKMVTATTDKYYENDTCYIVPLKYQGCNTMYFVKPKNNIDDVKFDDIFDKPIYNREVILKFPEFESESTMKLSDYFDEFGLSGVKGAKLSISDVYTLPPTISQVAKIKVDKDGTEAAAVTEMMFETSCALNNFNEPLKIMLDEPFYYMIQDHNTEDVAFIGRIKNMK